MTKAKKPQVSADANNAMGKGKKKTPEQMLVDILNELTEGTVVTEAKRQMMVELLDGMLQGRGQELESMGVSENEYKSMKEYMWASLLYQTFNRIPVNTPLDAEHLAIIKTTYKAYIDVLSQELEMENLVRVGRMQDQQMMLAMGGQGAAGGAQKDENPFEKRVQILPKRKPEDILKEVDEKFVGLEDVKKVMRKMVKRFRYNEKLVKRGLPPLKKRSYNLALLGNPGTGKSSIAYYIALLAFNTNNCGNRYLELNREILVGTHLGMTEDRVVKALDCADIVLTDEAYNLAPPSNTGDRKDFGYRVTDGLNTAMDKRRDSLMCMFAGYKGAMENFFNANDGLSSRISTTVEIEDPSFETLREMLKLHLDEHGITMEKDVLEHTMEKLKKFKTSIGPEKFGNGRTIRNIAEQLPDQIAERIIDAELENPKLQFTDEEMVAATKKDVDSINFVENMKKKEAIQDPGGFLTPEQRLAMGDKGFKPLRR